MNALHDRRSARFLVALSSLVAACQLAVSGSGRADDALMTGVAMVPADAAFLSATLRLREQVEKVLASNAFASVKRLPAVERALDALEEQKIQPGSPLSMAATFLELPENKQAVAVLTDMVSSDVFLYGEPSCITLLDLFQKVNRAQQAAGFLEMGRATGAGDGAAVGRRSEIVPVRRQLPDTVDPDLSRLQARLIAQTLVDNVESIVVPDLVWGFKITDAAAAKTQIERLRVMLNLVTQGNPDLAKAVSRKKVRDGEVMTITVDGAMIPWGEFVAGMIDDLDVDGFEAVLERLQDLDLVVALGLVGDRVILSLGDSADHLDKLATPGDGKGLVSVPALAPLREHRSRPITAISYASEALNKLQMGSTADIEQLAELSEQAAQRAGLSDEAAAEARRILDKVAAAMRRQMPIAGPTMGYSFMTDSGYEGYDWNWSKNLPYDGSKRLDLTSHVGGAPLAAWVIRGRTDAAQFEELVSVGGLAMSFLRRHVLPRVAGDDRDKVEAFDERLAPLAAKATEILRTKILPATADGQLGLVIDDKGRTKRLTEALPASADPLPLVEPAIAIRLTDAALFREGLSDLFSLADELVEQIRAVDPGAVPSGYRIPEPEKTKVPGGSVWSFRLGGAGLDEQIQPSIGVGDEVAVLSFVPKQAARIVAGAPLETGSQLTKYEEPLASAAALDVAGVIDLVEPWLVYAARYGSVQQAEGEVDADRVLSVDDENPQARDILGQVKVVLEALRSIRVAVAETRVTPEATVTRWRNVIRDQPSGL